MDLALNSVEDQTFYKNGVYQFNNLYPGDQTVNEYLNSLDDELNNVINVNNPANYDATYGNIFINQVFQTPPEGTLSTDNWYFDGTYKEGQATYSMFTYLNISSPYVAPVWGAYAHQAVLRSFF